MKKFSVDIATIKRAMQDRKLVVFAGAGISVDAGVPLWGNLIDSLKEDIDLPEKEKDYLRIPQMYYNERQHREYVEKVRRVLKHKQVHRNKIHEAIFELNPEYILTTNYDNLLDQVISAKALPFGVIAGDKEFPYAKGTKLLVKIHGSLDNDDFVLKEDDYLEYSTNHPLIESFIRFVFTSKVVLFVGYSFSDPNLKMIIQTVRNILGKDYQNAYLLSTDSEKEDVKDLHPVKREYLKRKGVVPIHYYDEEKFIENFLDGKNALKKPYRVKDTKLKGKGKTLLNFLTFVHSYNHFYQELSKKGIIDQQYYSLQRFDALPVLPPKFLAGLYPYNTEKHFFDYEHYGLRSRNNNITNLFFDQVYFDKDGNIRVKGEKAKGLSNEQISNQEQKLSYITKRLNQSQIHFIRKQEENGKWIKKEVSYRFKENCSCPKCLYANLKLDELIKNAANYSVTSTSDLEEDFLFAYANYKLSNFKLSTQQFEEIANKAWLTEQTLSYYIAKHNERHTRRLSMFFPREEDEEIDEESDGVKKEEIYRGENRKVDEENNKRSDEEKKKQKAEKFRDENRKKIDEIDLDKMLVSLPGIDDEQRELLAIVKNHSILVETSRVIDKPKIGSTHFIDIQNALVLLHSFYTEDCIVYDVFSEFKEVCEKGIESLLNYYTAPNSSEPKLNEFDYSFFAILVFHINHNTAKKLFHKYEIRHIPFHEKAFSQILEKVNSFLLSGIKQNEFQSAQNLKKQTSHNMFFGLDYEGLFNNIFLVLSRVKLERKSGKQLADNLMGFLKVESFLIWANIKYLSEFIYVNYHLFSYDDCETLLRIGANADRNKYFSGQSFLNAIYYVFKSHSFDDKITDRELITSILNLCKQRYEED